jgi:hypothetical protein
MGARPSLASALTPCASGVWTSTDPVRIVGMHLSATMAVVELPGARLLLFSPVEMTPERRSAVDALGTVAHLYAPNTFHHLWMKAWADAYPGALVHGPRALRAKRPDLRIDRAHDCEPPGELADVFDEVHVDGFVMEESVLVHRPSATLLVADLVHNIGRPKGLWTVTYSSAMGFYDRVAISRAIRLAAFTDHAAARSSVDRIAESTFDRIVVGHGSPIDAGAREAFREAYRWLRPRRRLVSPTLPTVSLAAAPRRRGCCG